ncbi:putative Homoserine O-acetyltransferase [Hypsibius exemplaris]|uniref:Homoserine O-acetyltransferase n=1 Tax=Hypsibius exemplaris TaxID=2072580 RepID=A0A1W0WQK0_HYPEX|nr:putative Homoserine O-acetyltransferase [Hypsibius exemplaris]
MGNIKIFGPILNGVLAFPIFLAVLSDMANAGYPTPVEADWIAHDFVFHTGEVFPSLRIHYTTVGKSSGLPVLLLHGTYGSGKNFLSATFADLLFGPGQPLDAETYFIIMPDGLGCGGSSKPSDGLRTSFPRYNYLDMVNAQHLLVTEGLGIKHLRLILGNSMGGMHTWLWGVTFPDTMDALVPQASQPTAMASRNWMLRRMQVEMVIQDPAYMGGNYTVQPPSLKLANVFFGIATSGGTLAWQAMAPTSELADKLVDARLAGAGPADANDWAYQWTSSKDYNPSAGNGLERITVPVLAINSADDERNPPESGLEAAALQRVKNARLFLIPASVDTRGHGTTGNATFWKNQLATFLLSLPTSGGLYK